MSLSMNLNNKSFKYFLVSFSFFLSSSWTIADNSQPAGFTINKALKGHIEFLADDLMLGRDTGSVEYEIAARYVASHFQQFGLTPKGDNNTWFQKVDFVEYQLNENSGQMILHKKGKTTSLNYPDDFLIRGSAITTEDQVKAKVVFAGFGIESKELNHNDYENLDVEGKIVAVLSGRPAHFPSEEGAHVSSGREKAKAAAKRGAIGLISIHTPLRDKVRTYEATKAFAGLPSTSWKKKDGNIFGTYDSLKSGAYISKSAAKTLFKLAGHNIEKVFTQIAKGKTPFGFELDIEVELKRQSSHKPISSSNIVGMIEGSDPKLKHEYVVYSAHLDHIGAHHHGEKEGDHINNGALDNASGIAIMLETARQFSQGKAPARSILFVAVTGEEKGLQGSNYFAHYPTVPLENIVANINLDMPMILYPFGDVIAFGAQHSTLGNYVKKAAAKDNINLSPDPAPEQAIFVRSDHYSFVKQGVPSIYLVPGMQSKDPTINGAAVMGQFLSKHYHKPSDDLSLPINYDAGALFTKINYNIGKEIANSNSRPQWHEGNFFGEAFKK